MIKKHAKKISGFSLIELMIVVAIIGIIVAFGYPIYTEKMIETRRTDAKEALSRLANLQEKIFTECNQYAATLVTTVVGSTCGPIGGAPSLAWSDTAPFLSADGHYVITLEVPIAGACTLATCFLLQADPSVAGTSGLQRRGAVWDGELRLDSAGRKSWDKNDANVIDAVGMYTNKWNDK